MGKDYYQTLGVGKDASDDEIKRAYRKMAMKYHPDRNKGDKASENMFKETAEAYEVLSDSQKKARYDQYGEEGLKGAFSGSGGGFSWDDFSHASDFDDIFSNIFSNQIFGDFFGSRSGRSRQRSTAQRGADLRVNLKLTMEEIASGVEKKINIKKFKSCTSCSGTGSKPGSGHRVCPNCKGTGEVHTQSKSFFGAFITVQPCSVCSGEGKIIDVPCGKCEGSGRIREMNTVSISVPAGVSTGNYIPLREQGDVGPRSGPPGDIIVLMEEQEHDLFVREDDNVIYDLPVSFVQAALGATVEVPTLAGRARLKIPSGTQSGKIFRMRGKGIQHLQSHGAGDQLVRVWIWTPTSLSRDEKKLLEKLSDSQNIQPPEGGKSFLDNSDRF